MIDWKTLGGVTLLSSSVVLTGCATAGAATRGAGEDEATPVVEQSETTAQIRALKRDVETRDARIETLQAELTRAEREQRRGGSTAPSADSMLFPPNAKPGQCYARVLTPEQYRTSDERVLVREASETVSVVPPRFENQTQRVLVKEESSRIETVPATYETVTERVLVKPASTEFVEVPATFRTVTEQVLDKPAYTVWKRGPASGFSDPVLSERVSSTGEVMCLVEVPATYKTITRQVLDKPAYTRKVEIPAEYKTVTKRVVKTPARTREVAIPAEYQTVTVRKLVEPAKEVRNKVPAEYRTVTKTEKISDAKLAWQEVLCDVNATRDNIVALQRALESRGYTVGPIDGVLGRQTLSAVSQYASKEGIPHGSNYVPLEVVKSLKLKI